MPKLGEVAFVSIRTAVEFIAMMLLRILPDGVTPLVFCPETALYNFIYVIL